MGAFACVDPNDDKIKSADSTEVFTVNLSSNSTLNDTRRDLESQSSQTDHRRHSFWWKVIIDLPLLAVGLTLLGLYELGALPSHRAGFFCKDPKLSYPFTGDTVPMAVLVVTVMALPVVVIFITEYVFLEYDYKSRNKFFQTSHQTLSVYRSFLYGMLLNFGVVEVMKLIAGSPRPTFFDICEPDTARTCNGSEWVPSFRCTSTRFSTWLQSDASHSFPSGHTSLSVHCAFFLMWYVQRRAFGWRRRSVLAVPMLQMALAWLAAVCSLTRVTDHRHHWWDVLAGTVIGVLSTLYSILVLTKNFAYIQEARSQKAQLNRNISLLGHGGRQV